MASTLGWVTGRGKARHATCVTEAQLVHGVCLCLFLSLFLCLRTEGFSDELHCVYAHILCKGLVVRQSAKQ